MKMFRLLFFGIIAVMSFSCGGFQDLGPNTIMILHMSFQDSEGNDLLAGIERGGPEGSVEGSRVAPSQYTLTSSPDLYEIGLFAPQPGRISYDDPHRYPRLELHKPVSWPDGSYSHVAINFVRRVEYDQKTVTYMLTCPHVFGDNEPHEIVTYWRRPDKADSGPHGADRYTECYRVVVDGRESAEIVYDLLDDRSFATIVLDR